MGQKIRFLKNKPEKLLKTKGKTTRVATNEPKNKAEKLLKTRTCGKTNRKQTENEATDVVEYKASRKMHPKRTGTSKRLGDRQNQHQFLSSKISGTLGAHFTS